MAWTQLDLFSRIKIRIDKMACTIGMSLQKKSRRERVYKLQRCHVY